MLGFRVRVFRGRVTALGKATELKLPRVEAVGELAVGWSVKSKVALEELSAAMASTKLPFKIRIRFRKRPIRRQSKLPKSFDP